MAHDDDYLLGTDDTELARLGFQHEVWSSVTSGLFDDARFGPGQRLVDLGCGPGYASVALARRVGAGGHVLSVDASERSIERVQARAAALELPRIEARARDVTTLDLDPESVDGVFARWLFCFLSEPELVVRQIARWLRPGGRVALLDYFRYASFSLAPRPSSMPAVVRAVVASWEASGGSLDVGGELPAMLERAGLRVTHLAPHTYCARPGSPHWHWPRSFFTTYLERLVEGGYLARGDADHFAAALDAAEDTPGAYLLTPTVIGIVAEKPLP